MFKRLINPVLLIIFFIIGVFISLKSFVPVVAEKPRIAVPQSDLPATGSSTFTWAAPPAQSLTAQVLSKTGAVLWQSRTATEGALVTVPDVLHQGENIITSADGQITFDFTAGATVSAAPRTRLNLIAALPSSLIFQQQSGLVTYTNTGAWQLSVRTMHLLLNQPHGHMSLSVNTANSTAVIRVTTGSATLGFNSLAGLSIVKEVPAGYQLTYSDLTRRIKLKRI